MISSPRLTRRRALLLGGAGAFVAGGLVFSRRINAFTGTELTPEDALDAVRRGQIVLIDIRRPSEWARTGIPEGAVPIDMRRDDFTDALLTLTQGDSSRPVALICARGVRSDRMSARLTEAGFSQVIDVPEGMLGSRAGPGWLARGLPVVQP